MSLNEVSSLARVDQSGRLSTFWTACILNTLVNFTRIFITSNEN